MKGMKSDMRQKSLKEQADAILRMAEDAGLEDNYFFTTTFKRYQVQLHILDELEKTIEEKGVLVNKSYVKGEKNLYSNPAVVDFNRTTDSANKTVATLLRILKSFDAESHEDADPLMDMINGADEKQ
jgi:hypothetical protein